jgi:formate-dependent nitrite reductase cytochrome c552 subunit
MANNKDELIRELLLLGESYTTITAKLGVSPSRISVVKKKMIMMNSAAADPVKKTAEEKNTAIMEEQMELFPDTKKDVSRDNEKHHKAEGALIKCAFCGKKYPKSILYLYHTLDCSAGRLKKK